MTKLTREEIFNKETLNSLLSYDKTSGKLFWKPRIAGRFCSEKWVDRWNNRFAYQPAFDVAHTSGYRSGILHKYHEFSHRVIWIMEYGELPNIIDHINGDRSYNVLSNLRNLDSDGDNKKNMKLKATNKSGVSGVYFSNIDKRWKAQINVDKRVKYIGSFISKDDAIAARKLAEIEHGYHQNHGKSDRPSY